MSSVERDSMLAGGMSVSQSASQYGVFALHHANVWTFQCAYIVVVVIVIAFLGARACGPFHELWRGWVKQRVLFTTHWWWALYNFKPWWYKWILRLADVSLSRRFRPTAWVSGFVDLQLSVCVCACLCVYICDMFTIVYPCILLMCVVLCSFLTLLFASFMSAKYKVRNSYVYENWCATNKQPANKPDR